MVRLPLPTSGLRLVASLLLLVILAMVDVHLVSSIHVFDVYRLVQLETISATGNQLFGSQKSSFTLQATTLTSEDLTRSVVIVPLAKLDLATFEKVTGTGSAVLVLLPERPSAPSEELLERWEAIERVLIGREVKIPVYFAFTDGVLHDLYTNLENSNHDNGAGNLASSLFTDTYNLAVSAPGETVSYFSFLL